MRVLSFIPAFLLAAASFVAAAPAAPGVPAAPGAPTDAAPSCVPSGGSVNDAPPAALQPVIAIFTDATAKIEPLKGKLESYKSNPDAGAVATVVVEIKAVIETAVGLLAQVKVDLNGLVLVQLGVAIEACITLILEVLSILVAIVVALAGRAVGTLQGDICDLLRCILSFVAGLQIFVVGDLVILKPLFLVVSATVQLLLDIVVHLNVAALIVA